TKALNLSLGNPDLIPPREVIELKTRFAHETDIDLYTYAEDKNLNRFCEGLIETFTGLKVENYPHLRYTPTAGIKTASALLPLACGLHLKDRKKFSVVTHLPAYDVMGTWSASYLGANRIVWPLKSETGMRMDLGALKTALDQAGCEKPDLIFVIRPGNPASQGATRQEWVDLIEFCSERGIRLANDGAYTTLTQGGHVTLAEVAKDYPTLEWIELYSLSKALSDPGARLGAILGSQDFVEDWVLVKGNTDSGPNPLQMVAYGELFKDVALTKRLLSETYAIYKQRLDVLIPTLKKAGLKPAGETTAGFFTLWQVPRSAFGMDLTSGEGTLSERFNRLVIDKTGMVGVHFTGPTGEAYIRYAVCSDILETTARTRFEKAAAEIRPEY
ncbi:MAG: aminotransferase class I/II-fold pyridoxal phosphate-dependent enzyme, partial [Proteobacteria bacterium]